MSAESLKKDSEELLRLSQLTESLNVRRILNSEAGKLKQLADLESATASNTASSKLVQGATYTTKITNYAWDQSEKFLKIYITLNGVHSFPTENLTADYTNKSFEFQALSSDKKNHALTIKNLLNEIVPAESYHKVKTDMVVLYLKKKNFGQQWSFVTEAEKKAKEPKATPKKEKEEDPGAGLMSLMKQMYDEGDDDMKRTIAKAWTEARDKKTDEVV